MIAAYTAPDEIVALLKEDEGLRLLPYKDTRGLLTIGYGHNLAVPIAPDVAALQLERDIEAVATQVAGIVGDDVWPTLAPARQGALIDMGFMGPSRLSRFEKMLAAIRIAAQAENPAIAASYWQTAHDECLNSQWAVDVKQARASRDADMLLTGEWPA